MQVLVSLLWSLFWRRDWLEASFSQPVFVSSKGQDNNADTFFFSALVGIHDVVHPNTYYHWTCLLVVAAHALAFLLSLPLPLLLQEQSRPLLSSAMDARCSSLLAGSSLLYLQVYSPLTAVRCIQNSHILSSFTQGLHQGLCDLSVSSSFQNLTIVSTSQLFTPYHHSQSAATQVPQWLLN